jgi:hypothetical protein
VCSLIAREHVLICTKLGTLMLWNQEEILESQNPGKTVLGSSPDEDGFCSSETKHDRRTAPRLKLFASARTLHKQRPQPQETPQGSSTDEDGFNSSGTEYDRRMAPRQSCLFRRGHYMDKGHNPENQSWVRVSVKMISVARKRSTKKERCQDQS